MKCFNKKMSRLQCTFNWINFSFITQSLKTKHIRMTRRALPPDTEQEPNYFNIILNYSISPRLADDHDTVWEHHSKQSSVKSSQSSFFRGCADPGWGTADFLFPFSPWNLRLEELQARQSPRRWLQCPGPAVPHRVVLFFLILWVRNRWQTLCLNSVTRNRLE